MGQGRSAPAPPANATPLRSGMVDVLPRPSRDRDCGGVRAALVHRWMNLAASQASIEAASVGESSTSESQASIEAASVGESSTLASEASIEAAPVGECSSSESQASIEAASVGESSTSASQASIEAASVGESSTLASEASIEAAPVGECSSSESQASIEAASVGESSTLASEASIEAAPVGECSSSESQASIEAASVGESSTSASQASIEAAPVDESSSSESQASIEAASVGESSTLASEASIEAAPVGESSTSESQASIEAAPVGECSSSESQASIGAASVGESSTSERDDNLLRPKHSIFLSHSGAQKSFVEQLCLDVERHDRYPFFDKRRDSLPIGEDFPKLIFEAIEQCQVGVVVLSEEFFSRSKWPMLELVALMKRKVRDPKFTIMPVFLGMTHGECRDKAKQERWLRMWEGWARVDNRIKVKEWQEALKVFGYTNGISLDNGLDEVKCRQEIVEAVCKRVRPNTRWDDSHVQGRSRLSSVIRERIGRVEVCKSYGARILGIWGMGGIGKTTTCKVLCNEYFEEFEGRVCHVEFGVGDMLQMVQEVLRRLTDTNAEVIGKFSNVGECKNRLKHELKKKVLLAVDNVSDSQEVVDNAKELLRLGYSEESIMIVTARSLPQLQNLNLEDCMQLPKLEEEDAISLFLHHAAPNMYLKNAGKINEQLVKKCVKRCHFRKGYGMDYHYHPLALKVLGGQLGNKVDEWMAKLELYEGDPFNQYGEKDHPVFSILGRSFEILNDEDKLLFMDVAIFLPESGFEVVNTFEWLSLVHGKGLQVIMRRLEGLKSKSLVEDLGDGKERIAVHDLWHEYAELKARGRKYDQAWICEKMYEVNDPRREESDLSAGGWASLLRILIVGMNWPTHGIMMELDLSRCLNLRVLKLEGVKVESQVLDLIVLQQLKSLMVFGNWDDEIEVYFVGLGSLRNLVYLDLSYLVTNLIVLLEDIGSLTNLRVLYVDELSHKMRSGWFTKQFEESTIEQKWRGEGWIVGQLKDKGANATVERKAKEIGNFVGVVGPTQAEVMGCPICKDSSQVKELVLMESPPKGNAWLGLKSLDLSRLILLRDVYISIYNLDIVLGLNSNMTCLKRLRLIWCSSLRCCHGVGDLVALEELDLSHCGMLEEVPHLGKLENLLELRVNWCKSIKAVSGLGDLVSLKVFEVRGCDKLAKLPINMRKLRNLQTLNVGWCPRIKAMQGLSELIGMKELDADFVGLRGCHDLHKLEKLKSVHIHGWGSKGIPCLVDLQSLLSLRIENAYGVDKLSGVSNLRRLQELVIQHCDFLDVLCLSNLTTLRSLIILSCFKLQRLPNMHKLSRLKSLKISYCGSLREWDSGNGMREFGGGFCIVGALLCLQTLSLRCNIALTELPNLSHFPKLKKLKIYNSERLTSFTNSAPLTALEVLSLKRCGVVRALRSEVDLSHVVSSTSLKLWRSGVLLLMVHEIEKLQVMCLSPKLGTCNTRNLQVMNR